MGRLEEHLRDIVVDRFGSIPKFAEKMGMSPQTVYTLLKRGVTSGTTSTVLPILAELGLDLNWVVRNRLVAVGETPNDFYDVPLHGSIAAGSPIEMLPVDETHPIPMAVHEMYPDAFLLNVRGESMNRILPNGSMALVEPCESVDRDMDPYAVCVNGFDATVKRVRRLANGFELVPDSTDLTFKTTVYDYGVEGTDTVTVIGRVVWYCIPYSWSFR